MAVWCKFQGGRLQRQVKGARSWVIFDTAVPCQREYPRAICGGAGSPLRPVPSANTESREQPESCDAPQTLKGDGGSSVVVFCRPWSTEAVVEHVSASTSGEDRGAMGGGVES